VARRRRGDSDLPSPCFHWLGVKCRTKICHWMVKEAARPPKVQLRVTIPSDLRVKMIQLGIHPSGIARGAFEREVRAREELELLAKVRLRDPRITMEDLRKMSKRTKRLVDAL